MLHDEMIRSALMVIFSCLGLIWFGNLLRIGPSVRSVYDSREGPWMFLATRLPMLVSVGALAVWFTRPEILSGLEVAPPEWGRWLGVTTTLLGAVLFAWVLASLGAGFSMSLTVRDDQKLVTHGVYGRIRHPMYTSACLLLSGATLASGQLLIGVAALVGLGFAMGPRARHEEAMMLARFGQTYRDYMARSGRYLPRLQPDAASAPAYRRANSKQTLREALDEFHRDASEPLMREGELEDRQRDGLRAHDAAHVVFGCDTSVVGEIVLARWSIFGSSGVLPLYMDGLRRRQTRALAVQAIRKLRPLSIALGIRDGFRAAWRAFQMTRRWPILGYAEHLDQPLDELRREFNIRIL